MANGDYTGYGAYLNRHPAPDGSDVFRMLTTIPGGSVNPAVLTAPTGGVGGGANVDTPIAGPETTLHKINLDEGMIGFVYQVYLQFFHAINYINGVNIDYPFGFGSFPYTEQGWWKCEVFQDDSLSALLFSQRVDWTWILHEITSRIYGPFVWDYTERITTDVVDGDDTSSGTAINYLDNGWTSENNTQHGVALSTLGTPLDPTTDPPNKNWEGIWINSYTSAPYRMWVPPTAVVRMTFDQQTLGQRNPLNGSGYFLSNNLYPIAYFPHVSNGLDRWPAYIAAKNPGQSEMYVNLIVVHDEIHTNNFNYDRGWNNQSGPEVNFSVHPRLRTQPNKIGSIVDPAGQIGVASDTNSSDDLHIAYTRYKKSFFNDYTTLGEVPDRTAYASLDEDAAGNLFVLARDIDLGQWNFYNSSDSGRSWSLVATAWDNSYEQADFLISAVGAFYSVAIARADGFIYLSSSTDQGQTWTSPVAIYTGSTFDADSGPLLREKPNGELWLINHNGPLRLSKDSGKTWDSIPII